MQAFHGKQEIKDKYLAIVSSRMRVQNFITEAIKRKLLIVDPEKGRIYFGRTKTEMKTKNKFGYVVGTLHMDGIRMQLKAHQIIYLAAYGKANPRYILDHINRDKSDNRIENLRLVSNKENSNNRRSYIGMDNPSAKVSPADIRKLRADGLSYGNISKALNVSESCVANHCRAMNIGGRVQNIC